jgi:nucleoside-diphosphate-sugar epimerase
MTGILPETIAVYLIRQGMKNILVIGGTGQIGSELTMKLRGIYGDGHVVCGYIPNAAPKGKLLESGPAEIVDITDAQQIADVVKKHDIDSIYNLAALLSAVAEARPQLAWNIGVNGLYNALEVSREHNCALFTPSSIGSFGLSTPHVKTPQDTVQRPQTIYGVTKVTGELLSDYYAKRFGVDTRSVRFPGLISYTTPPGGGTTDYAVDIYYSAVKGETFKCPLKPGTFMDMMYMPDALRAAVEIMEADPSRLVHRNSFNIASMSFDPEIIYNKIKEYIPDFRMEYELDPLRQSIADSWPDSLDDSCARTEWDWKPEFDLDGMSQDMIRNLRVKLLG